MQSYYKEHRQDEELFTLPLFSIIIDNLMSIRTSGRSAPLVLVPGFDKECD